MSASQRLTSPHNPTVQYWRELNRSRRARLASRSFLAEGEHMTTEALKTGMATALICSEDAAERFSALLGQAQALPVWLVSGRVLETVTDTRTPQGIAAVCAMPRHTGPVPLPLIAALENVQDPGNVGTVLRTMDAIGQAGVLLSADCADVYAPKTLRASMGAVFRVPVWVAEDFHADLLRLKAGGTSLLAGALDGTPFYERPEDGGSVCLLIGNEGQGLSTETAALADQKVRLPMPGRAESLNAAVACAVMAYDVLRRRLSHDGQPSL